MVVHSCPTLTCVSSTAGSRPKPPARVMPAPGVVTIDGQQWHTCPLGGAACMRVAATISRDWAEDVIAVHLALHHRAWR